MLVQHRTDPFAYLGMHATGDGVVVRASLPLVPRGIRKKDLPSWSVISSIFWRMSKLSVVMSCRRAISTMTSAGTPRRAAFSNHFWWRSPCS